MARRRARKPGAAPAPGGRTPKKAAARSARKTPAARSAPGRPRPRKRAPASRKAAAPVVDTPVVEAAPPPVDVEESGAAFDVDLAAPEVAFAARVPAPEADRPFPAARRAIFFDVENTSRPGHIARVIDHLAVDRMGRRTDFVAVGNWKVIGLDTARLLARHGAQLVHSAPATGVRDWSDLRIAVAAGAWLASARPGDVLEIVTNDRAFDAVGDVAAGLGIAYRRLSHEGLAGPAVSEPPPPAPAREPGGDSRSRRRRRGRGSWRGGASSGAPRVERAPEPAPPPALVAEVPAEIPAEIPAEPHTAPHDELIAVIYDLMRRSPGRPVTIDSLANALKQRGFSRPSGSPRLITRIRRIKEIHLNRAGVLTLVTAGVGGEVLPLVPAELPLEPAASDDVGTVPEPLDEGAEDDGPDGNRAPDAPAPPQQRRHSRRGRWRRRPAPTGAPAT